MTTHRFHLPAGWAERTVRIELIGAGGTGSQLADQLASLEATLRRLGHPGFEVTVWDADVVGESNIGRQRFTHADIGANKAALIVHRINAFYGVNWRAKPQHFRVDAGGKYLPADLLITAVDLAGFRADLGRAYRSKPCDTMWLDTGNGPDLGNAILGHLGHPRGGDVRLPNVFDLFPELATMEAVDREAPSCSTEEAIRRQAWPINRIAALTAAELLWTLFRTGHIETHGAFFRLAPITVQPLRIDPAAWAFMGWTSEVDETATAT